jgi:hypothetical protein
MGQQTPPPPPSPYEDMGQQSRSSANKQKSGKRTGAIIASIVAVVVIVVCIVLFIVFGQGSNNDSTSYDYNYSDNEITQPDDSSGTDSSTGTDSGTTGGVGADDGELHDAFDSSVNYSADYDTYTYSGSAESIGSLTHKYDIDINVNYPVIVGDFENIDEINATIKDTAMAFVDNTFTKQESDSFYYKLLESSDENLGSDETGVLSDQVSYAITYNTDHFISICFSDQYLAGSVYSEFVELRTVNINLDTGEVYTFDDTLNMTEEIADAWISNMQEQDSTAIDVMGVEGTKELIMGETDEDFRAYHCMFVDGNGKVNVGITFWFSNDGAISRGWWDVTLDSSVLDPAIKDSSSTFWTLIPSQ